MPAIKRALLCCMLALLLVGCGSADETESEPTEPSRNAIPTVIMTEPAEDEPTVRASPDAPGSPVFIEETPSVPTNTDMSGVAAATADPAQTERRDDSEHASPVAEDGTNGASVSGDVATPGAAGQQVPADEVSGDGTTGAIEDGFLATPDADMPSPVAATSTGEVRQGVTGCDVENPPPFTESASAYLTIDEVNVRVGPSLACDLLLEEPLDAFESVTVVSDPVVDSDGTVWVMVRVSGGTCWVAADFIEPEN